jgi:dipeptidyl aminopeptidase/acylaminoacyl peptidase
LLPALLVAPGAPAFAQRFWDRFMGVRGPDDATLDGISPIKHLDAVSVPVLLIHGRDDHWLSRGETRLQLLQASVDFLRANNPPD